MGLSTEEKRRIRLAFEDLRADLKADHLFYSASVYSNGHNECYQARADMLSIALDKLEYWREKPEGYLIRGMCKVMVLLQSLRDEYGESINRWHIPDEHREVYCHKQLTSIIIKIEDSVNFLGHILGNNWR
jgi:hypothetical protein